MGKSFYGITLKLSILDTKNSHFLSCIYLFIFNYEFIGQCESGRKTSHMLVQLKLRQI